MPNSAARSRLVANYGQLPLRFEANQGQIDAQVKFLSRGSGYTLFLTGNEAVFALHTDRNSGFDKHPGLSVPSSPWNGLAPGLGLQPPERRPRISCECALLTWPGTLV
jgi:hypothetical protein